MAGATFDLSLTLPADRRFVAMVRDLAVHGAKQAGHSEADAEAFGRKVEAAARESLAGSSSTATVPVTVRCAEGPVEVTIGSCCVSTTR
jgi:hypothetical protein